MKKIAIIGNKRAGKGRALDAFQQARRALWGWKTEFFCPDTIEEMHASCERITADQYQAAIVIGGDGTINQSLRGLLKSDMPVLPFPAGTANDLAAELGIAADWEQVQRLLDRGATERIDLVEVNDIPFATVAGVGAGAKLTSEYNKRRESSWLFRELSRRMQSQVYTLLSAKTVLLGSGFDHHLHIKSDVFDEKLKTSVVFICNQARLGGDLKVAATNDNDDRKFSVLIIPGVRRDRLIHALVEMKLGKLSESNFILFSTDRLTMKDLAGKPIEVFGDGDILAKDSLLSFRILPEALSVFRTRKGDQQP